MKKINNVRKLARHLFAASLIVLTSFSVADAQRGGGHGGGGRGFSGGRSFGGGGTSRGFSGAGPRINAGPRVGGGGFGGGNRIAATPRFAPGRTYGGIRGGVSLGFNYRGGYGYGRANPYYGGGYGAYYRGYFPHIGFYLNVLPYGYYPFSYGGYPYYYNQGLFYQQYNNGYQVVAPPVGADIPNLPRGAQDITIDGQQYFEKDGVYYQPVINQDGRKVYRVMGKDGVLNTDGNQQDQQQYNDNAPQTSNQYPQQQYNNNLPRVGDVVNSVPADSRKVKINGERLFVSPDGVYYQEDNSGNTRIFKVVGVPSEDGGTDTIAAP